MVDLKSISNLEKYKLRSSFSYFNKVVFNQEFYPKLDGIIDSILRHRYNCVVIPTGHAKTTVFSHNYPLWRMWRETSYDIGLVSSSITQSKEFLSLARDTVEDNPFFADLLPSKAERELRWNSSYLRFKNGNKFRTLSFTSSSRGAHPNEIIFDDLLRDEESSLEKTAETFWSVFFPRGQIKDVRFLLVGTPQMDGDLYDEIYKKSLKPNSQWNYVKEPAAKVNDAGKLYDPLWAEMFPIPKLEMIRENMGDYRFRREYLCDPMATSSNIYSGVKYAIDENLGFDYHINGELHIGLDFALSTSSSGDYNAYSFVDVMSDDLERTFIVNGLQHKVVVKNPIVLKHLTRYKASSGHAKTIANIIDMFDKKPTSIVADKSTFGKIIISDLRDMGFSVIEQDFQRELRNDLLIGLMKVFEIQDNYLSTPPRMVLPYSQSSPAYGIVKKLVKELKGFEEKKTPSGMHTFATSTLHDDTVMSLAMAVKNVVNRRRVATGIVGVSPSDLVKYKTTSNYTKQESEILELMEKNLKPPERFKIPT